MKRLPIPLLVLLAACSSTPRPAGSESSLAIYLDHPPQSALTGLVRSLEVLDALHDPSAEVRLRAIECDSLIDRDRGAEYVRVVLDLTVIAQRPEEADRVFQDLADALDAEARSTTRPDAIALGRVQRVFEGMDWSASGVPMDPSFRHLVSLSDSIRVEVARGRGTSVRPSEAALEGSLGIDEYIQEIARDERVAIGEVDIADEVFQPWPGMRDLRYGIQPRSRRAPLSRVQIGNLLYLLEARSPGVKVTSVAIHPVEPGSDVTEDGWTFEAEISVRTPAG